jgi:hypothetical protein
MQQGSQHRRYGQETPRQGEKTIQEWKSQYPGTWILLAITQEDEGEPVRGLLIATADDPEDMQDIWKTYRVKGVLTMLTYGQPREPIPEVVASAT